MARRLVLSSVRWPGDICPCCAHLDFLLVSMLLLMLFSSRVLLRPLSVFSSCSVPPALARTMLDQVVRLPGAAASLSEE